MNHTDEDILLETVFSKFNSLPDYLQDTYIQLFAGVGNTANMVLGNVIKHHILIDAKSGAPTEIPVRSKRAWYTEQRWLLASVVEQIKLTCNVFVASGQNETYSCNGVSPVSDYMVEKILEHFSLSIRPSYLMDQTLIGLYHKLNERIEKVDKIINEIDMSDENK